MKPIDEFSGKGLTATDSERQIIAAILEGSTDHLPAMERVLPDAEAFLDRECSLIWRIALSLHQSAQPVGFDTIKAVLATDPTVKDSNAILHALQGSHALINREHAEWHAKQVATAYARRESAEAFSGIEYAETSPQELAAFLREKADVIEGIAMNTGESLPEPVPITVNLHPVMPFDIAWLPQSLAPWISDIADRMQCPPDFPAVAAMVALSSVAGRRFAIQPKEQDEAFFEFPHQWGMIVGRPSLMKSPSMQAAMRPLRALETSALLAHKESDRDLKAQKIASKIKRHALEQEAKKAARKSLEFDYSQLLDEEQERVAVRRLIVNDASLEALGEV